MTVPSNEVMFQSCLPLFGVVLSLGAASNATASTGVVFVGATQVRLDGRDESGVEESLLVGVDEATAGSVVGGLPVVEPAVVAACVVDVAVVGVPLVDVPAVAGIAGVEDTTVGTDDTVLALLLHAVKPASRSAAQAAERARRAIIWPTLCVVR